MSDTRNPIKVAFEDELKRHSFQKKSGAWNRASEETVQGISLIKSDFGAQYYIELAFLLKSEIEGSVLPPFHKWHVRLRIDSLPSIDAKSIADLLDFEQWSDETSVRRVEAIVMLLRTVAIPFLDAGRTQAGLKELVQTHIVRAGLVLPVVHTALGFG